MYEGLFFCLEFNLETEYSIECTYYTELKMAYRILRITQIPKAMFLVKLKMSIIHYLYFKRLNRTCDTVLGAACRTSDT